MPYLLCSESSERSVSLGRRVGMALEAPGEGVRMASGSGGPGRRPLGWV